jgi:hypothetical protein
VVGLLPVLPSRLLQLGLEDLRRCEQDPDCQIDLGVWVSFRSNSKVRRRMSLPGAVMYRQLGIGRWRADHLTPGPQLSPPDCRCLRALRELQSGRVRQAFRELDLPWGSVRDWVTVTPYHFSRTQFLQDLQQLVHALEIRGY